MTWHNYLQAFLGFLVIAMVCGPGLLWAISGGRAGDGRQG
jgi:hypothetical protein